MSKDGALDIVHGRQGGRRLPALSGKAERLVFAQAMADGQVVYAECLCSYWWLAPVTLGEPCDACGHTYRTVPDGNARRPRF